MDKSTLQTIDVPNLPFKSYQCPKCGRHYSGQLYDAGKEGWAGTHLTNSAEARYLGFAYGITGRKEFATAAARILRAYIDRYLKLPISAPEAGSPVFSHTSGAVRIASTYMREQRWLTNLAIALDFVRDGGFLSPEELRGIEEKVFVPSAHLMMDHKVGAMNLQWMIESGALYAGLASENPGLTARALYDKHGIVNLIRVGYLPDGNWWENPSYQNVANGVAFPVLATCINNGILPWNERLNLIFKAAYKTYAPDGRGPTLGTGGPGGYHYTDNAIHSLAGFVNDPELAWIAHNRRLWRAWSGGGQPYSSYLWALTWKSQPKLPKDKTQSPIPDMTTNLPHYGGIALRNRGKKNYCYLHYGRELVHGHPNKLSINAYAKGGWFVRNVMGGYGDNFKNFLNTIASSTSIMVDGRNPDADTGELLFHKSGDGWDAASAREVGAYKDVEHERSMVLAGDLLIVLDRCVSETEHTYDWLYHTSLTRLSLDGALKEVETKRPGGSQLYESFVPIGDVSKRSAVTFKRQDGSGVRIAFLNGDEIHAFKALKKYDGLLWRKKGKTLSFAAVYWPFRPDEKGEVSIAALPLKDTGIAQGQAVKVNSPEGKFVVLVNYGGKELQCDTFRSKERVSVFRAP